MMISLILLWEHGALSTWGREWLRIPFGGAFVSILIHCCVRSGRQSASVRTMLSRVFADVYHSGEITRVQLEVAKQQWADARTMAVQQHEYLRWQLSNHAETMRHLENRKDRLDRERVLDERERERVAAMHEEKERAERLRVEALLKAEDDKIRAYAVHL